MAGSIGTPSSALARPKPARSSTVPPLRTRTAAPGFSAGYTPARYSRRAGAGSEAAEAAGAAGAGGAACASAVATPAASSSASKELLHVRVLLIITLLLAGGLVLGWMVIRRRYILPTPADEIHHAATADGWLLALYRYRPKNPLPRREPVLLCHGMLSNRFNVDLDEEVSLARHLRQAGFDAWVMELRGHGRSVRREGRPGGFDWSLDDYI